MRIARKLLSVFLSFTMLFWCVPAQAAYALTGEEGLVAAEVDASETTETTETTESSAVTDEIAQSGKLYLGASSVQLPEGQGYVLKVARGGQDLPAVSARLTFVDITAEYGVDYTVSVRDAQQQVSVNHDNPTLLSEVMENPDELVEVDGIDLSNLSEEELQQLYANDEAELNDFVSKQLQDYAADHPGEYTVPVEESQQIGWQNELSRAFSASTGLVDDNVPMSSDGTAALDANALMGGYALEALDDLSQAFNSATIGLNFAEGQSEIEVEINALENAEAKGNLILIAGLFDESASGQVSEANSFTATILDNEEWQHPTVAFSAKRYAAEDGYINVTIERSGLLSGFSVAKLTTEDGTAVHGRDFSEVDTTVFFPVGVAQRTLRIPVRGDYLIGEGLFTLKLSEPENCTLGSVAQATGSVAQSSGNYFTSVSTQAATSALRTQAELQSEDMGTLPLDLSRGAASESQSSSVNKEGDHIELKANGWSWDTAYAELDYYTSSENQYWHSPYSYSGIRFDWEKSGGGDSETWVQVSSDRWNVQLDKKIVQDEWDRKTETLYFTSEAGGPINNVSIRNSHNGSAFSSASSLKIYSAELIPRKVTVSASVKDPEKLNFVGEDGTLINYTEANLPGVGKIMVSGQEGGSVSASHGDTLTFTIDETYTYIKALWVDDLKLGADYPAGTKSVSLNIDEGFFTDVGARLNLSGADGAERTGKVDVKVELGQYESQITFHNDDARGKVEYAFEANKNGVHKGDWVGFRQTLDGAYSAAYKQSCLRLVRKVTTDSKVEDARVSFDEGSADTYTTNQFYTSIDVYPVFEDTDNRVVVRVSDQDLQKFDQNAGIFAGERSKAQEGYTDFTAVSTSDLQAWRRYALTAKPLDDGYVAVWQPAFKGVSYSQNTFWCEADTRTENNVILLSCEKADDVPYSLEGTTLYSNISLVGGTEGEAWMPADDSVIEITPYAYGLTDEKGKFATVPMKGIAGCKVIYRVVAMGRTEYKTINLRQGQKTQVGEIDAYSVDVGSLTVNSRNKEAPFVAAATLTSGDINNTMVAYLGSGDDDPIANTFTVFVYNDGAAYVDDDGVTKSESVKGVEIYAYDPLTNTVRGQIGESATRIGGVEGGRSIWQVNALLAEGDGFYRASDRIYARIITDREKGQAFDADGNPVENSIFSETVYPDIYTGFVLSTTIAKESVTYDLDILDQDLGNYVTLPLYGGLNFTCLVKGFAMSFQILPGNVHRFSVGKILNTNDYVNDIGEEFDGFKEGVAKIKEFGRQVKGDGRLVPKGGGGVYPFLGIYLDFGPTELDLSKGVSFDMELIGGGVYVGAQANFRYSMYLPISCVPVYWGANGSLTAYATIGLHDADKLNERNLKDGDADLKGSLSTDFTLKAEGAFDIYAGVGLARTLGVRGGVSSYAQYIYNPTIRQTHPDYDVQGMRISVGLKIWVDAFFFTVPIPVLTLVDEPYGYIEQMDKDAAAKTKAVTTHAADQESLDGLAMRAVENSSAWLPESKEGLLFGAASEASSGESTETVLQTGGYDHADPQLLDMGEDGLLLVFVRADASKPVGDQTTLMYSVYKNGQWSEPVAIGSDDTLSTADFQPNLCDAGQDVMISWVSRQNKDYETALEYLGGMDVYTCLFNKSTHEVTDVECLTEGYFDDSAESADPDNPDDPADPDVFGYYNCDPVGIYDEASGDRLVYYQKSAAETKDLTESGALYQDVGDDYAELLANLSPTQNGSMIAYLLYDHSLNDGEGGWARDFIYENEVSNQEAREYLIQNWGGQRFLGSAISEDDWEVSRPTIVDFDAISYNGIGIYAFTVDKDNSLDTDYDRDLFLQVYNFGEHKTYHTVRISDDTVSDARPQLIRSTFSTSDGNQGAHTWLFWLEGANVASADGTGQEEGTVALRYLDVARLISVGIEDDGTIGRTTYNDKGESYTYDLADEVKTLFYTPIDGTVAVTFDGYRAFVDESGNLYIAWLQQDDESGVGAQEVFAAAFIDGENGSYWSDAVRLTNTGLVNDEVAIAVDSNGVLHTVGNQYSIDMMSETSEACEVTDVRLVATSYADQVSVEPLSVAYSNNSPKAGQSVTATVEVKNTGLKPVQDYQLQVFEVKDGVRGSSPVFTWSSDSGPWPVDKDPEPTYITPGARDVVSFDWTMPDNLTSLNSLSLYAVATTTDNQNTIERASDLDGVKIGADFQLVSAQPQQKKDGFYLAYEIRNVGNVASKKGEASLLATFNDLYGEGVEETWLKEPVDALQPGASTFAISKLDISEDRFTRGFTNGFVDLVDSAGQSLGVGTDVLVAMEFPATIVVNGDAALSQIVLEPGQSLKLSGDYTPKSFYPDGTVAFSVDDGEVAHMEGDMLVADTLGATTLRAMLVPYGGEKLITVRVAAPDTPADGGQVKPIAQADVKLAKTSYVYTGKNIKCPVTVKHGATILKSGTDYAVSYANNKKVGKATVKVTGLGKWSGTVTKTFNINPKGSKLTKVKGAKKRVTAKWKKQTKQTTGYRVQICKNKKFKSGVKTKLVGKKRTKLVVKGLKSGKRYYVRIQTYKKVGSAKYYSAWSKAKAVKVK